MKSIKLATFLIAVSLTPAWALAAQGAEGSPAPQALQPAVNVEEFDKHIAQAQEHLKKMAGLMTEIQQTKDPKERQNLLQEHQALMQRGMGMMGDLWGRGMTGRQMMKSGMMGWKDMRDRYSTMTPEQMKQHQYMMDRYMGMQQMMIDQLMQHQYQMNRQPR
ncbi:hypothetical protein [Metapseudomonas boanensis]|uniref:Uncharacterized protein n=1 Tax=Metapseudomonas boanensis TaxID=2822138 RepID=A0ABS5XAU0_9GAMM|nr:hypothetical protein [Pseudomonas boanensis]MBT8764804.1 hypothetical protein [Pseudomonas boanensis]